MARAGRIGRAYSVVSPEEMPYVVDLFLFLGRALRIMRMGDNGKQKLNFFNVK